MTVTSYLQPAIGDTTNPVDNSQLVTSLNNKFFRYENKQTFHPLISQFTPYTIGLHSTAYMDVIVVYSSVDAMEWLDDDVIYGVACALLLTLLIRELLATVAQYVPLSRTLHWLPTPVRLVIASVEPICENLTGE